MPSVKRVLGRGLADLIPVGGDGPGNRTAELGPGQEAPIATLHPNPRQPRTRFDEAALAELADSVRANGILQPLLVRPRPSGGYEIVAGERRYRAALRAGLKEVPVVVRQLSDEETLALALIENLIREDIGPMETARAFHRLMEDFGWTQEEMGKRVGKSRSTITNSLRLLSLPEPIQQSLERGELTEGHARSLIGDERQRAQPGFREHQIHVWRQITTKNISVREVERLMKTQRTSESAMPEPVSGGDRDRIVSARNAEWADLEDRMRTALGTQVRLVGAPGRGRVEIEFFSEEELDGLLGRLENRLESVAPSVSTPSSARSRSGGGPISGLLSTRRPA